MLSAGIGAASAPWQTAVLRAGAWTARGLRVPARNALLADVVSPARYGRAYGFERAMDMGAIAGPLLAILLVGAVGTRWAIGLSVIPGLLAALAIIYAIRHTPAPASRERRPIRLQVRPVLRGRLGRLMAGTAAFEIGNCAATLLILRATELFAPGRSDDHATQLALALCVAYNLAATLISIPAGHYGDRHSPIHVLAAGAACSPPPTSGSPPDPAASPCSHRPSSSLASGSAAPRQPNTPRSPTLAPEDIRGSGFGLLAAIQSIGNLAASTITGILGTAASPTVAFLFLATAMTIAVPVLALGAKVVRAP